MNSGADAPYARWMNFTRMRAAALSGLTMTVTSCWIEQHQFMLACHALHVTCRSSLELARMSCAVELYAGDWSLPFGAIQPYARQVGTVHPSPPVHLAAKYLPIVAQSWCRLRLRTSSEQPAANSPTVVSVYTYANAELRIARSCMATITFPDFQGIRVHDCPMKAFHRIG